MISRLIHALVQTKNEAADAVLVEALRLGTPPEQQLVLNALMLRRSVRGLSGVIAQYDRLPETLQVEVLENIKLFHAALRESGRSTDPAQRAAALKLIALGRQGKLAYVLSENLHERDEEVSKGAADALVSLSRWVASETRKLQTGTWSLVRDQEDEPAIDPQVAAAYAELLSQRPEIEAAVARAVDVHRGRHGKDLLHAAMLLCDWTGSKTFAMLNTAKHGGHSTMARRLQQPPLSEHVDAFLLGASHGQLRGHFGVAFGNIDDGDVLDALLRRTHWLKDHQLQLCVHQVSRGVWCGENTLVRDIERRTPDDAARVGEWIAASGLQDVVQDERLDKIRIHAQHDFASRLRLLRIAARRKKGTSTKLLQKFLNDPDERLVRMAAREIVRRRPPEMENALLQLMTGAPQSVRRVISRAIGQTGFEHFWLRYDRLPKATRRQAGKAMLKILPDAVQRLSRRLVSGPLEQRLKAMQMVGELGLAETLRSTLVQLCSDSNPRLRSKAVTLVGQLTSAAPDALVERLLHDSDARVRANTIEVLESQQNKQFLPALAQRARASNSRERANAIKALNSMKVGGAVTHLGLMLNDERPEHRISGMWMLHQVGWWNLLGEVGRLARDDANLRVRRYALGVLRNVAALARDQSPQPRKAG